MQKLLIILFIAATLLGACSKNIEVDNPRSEEVLFVVDGAETKVPAKSKTEMSLSAGRHEVKVLGHDGVQYQAGEFEVKEGGLLHSGGTDYIIWRQLYGLQADRQTLLNEDWLSLDSVKVHGDFKLYPDSVVYIEKSWDDGIDDELPKETTLFITSDFVIKSKIFRLEDFVHTYRQLSKGNQ
jgi:hypothetical protein